MREFDWVKDLQLKLRQRDDRIVRDRALVARITMPPALRRGTRSIAEEIEQAYEATIKPQRKRRP